MKRTTAQLLEILKNQKNYDDYVKENEENFVTGKPCDLLKSEIEKRGFSKAEVIRNSGIERHYAYQILSGVKKPSREKIIMFCFGMGMNFEETQHFLLECSASALYAKNKRDNVTIFAIENQLSIIELNDLLYELNLKIYD